MFYCFEMLLIGKPAKIARTKKVNFFVSFIPRLDHPAKISEDNLTVKILAAVSAERFALAWAGLPRATHENGKYFSSGNKAATGTWQTGPPATPLSPGGRDLVRGSNYAFGFEFESNF